MKYCNNCKKETNRYVSGHCKPCNKKRTDVINKKRSSKSMTEINRVSISKEKSIFDKSIYYEFNISDVIHLNKTGHNKFVYFLLNNNDLVYIGKSNGNLLSRLNSHIKDKDFDSVFYKVALSDKTLNDIEKQLITKYRPKLNREYIFNNAKYDIFDLKTEITIRDTKENLTTILKANINTVNGLLNESRKKIHSRYILLKNKPVESSFRNVLDNNTGEIEKHNYITFSEKVGKSQNQVWYFMNGITKTFLKKRYTLVD